MQIEINKSRNRQRTVSAKVVGETIQISAPQNIPDEKLKEIIENLRSRIEKRTKKRDLTSDTNLQAIVQNLNEKYFEGEIEGQSIEYSTNQDKIFGCCTYREKRIRISHRLATMPTWVRDYVIIHEMAHIIEPNHSKSFWGLVNRYPLTERARGYLIAKGATEEEF